MVGRPLRGGAVHTVSFSPSGVPSVSTVTPSRPDSVGLVRTGDGPARDDDNRITAGVTGTSYHGTFQRVRLAIGDQQLIVNVPVGGLITITVTGTVINTTAVGTTISNTVTAVPVAGVTQLTPAGNLANDSDTVR